jgi:hypothetical protein
MEILDFKKNHTKPIVITMRERITNEKYEYLATLLEARVMEDFTLPLIGIKSDMNKQAIVTNSSNIDERLAEVVREIHFSYMTKEYLIKVINEKYPSISKTSLNSFFKDKAHKVSIDGKVDLYNTE